VIVAQADDRECREGVVLFEFVEFLLPDVETMNVRDPQIEWRVLGIDQAVEAGHCGGDRPAVL
jgi:hypothetical protein